MKPQDGKEWKDAEAQLASGDAEAALVTLRALLSDRAAFDVPSDLGDALRFFARVLDALPDAPPELAAKLRGGATDDLQALYDLGYALIEQKMPGVAATVLSRALVLAPGEEGVVTELCAAFEAMGRNDEAVALLRSDPELLEDSALCRYLLGFNALVTADVDEARRMIESLARERDETMAFLRDSLSGMVGRLDALRGAGRALDERDLRGWHFVVTGALLLHVSPHGFEEGMRGRYAFVQDSPALVHENLLRLRAVLEELGVTPEAIAATPDRDGTVLAHAASRVLERKLVPLSEKSRALIVAYDLELCDLPTARLLSEHRKGQLLFTQAGRWTDPFPFTPDVVGFLHQQNHPWWRRQLTVDASTKAWTLGEADTRAPEEIAEEIAAAQVPEEALADLDDLRALARIAKPLTGAAAAGALRASGKRRRNYGDSPVKSNRFL